MLNTEFISQSFFGLSFGQNADIDIILDNQDERKMAEIRDENGRKERHYLFFDGESVTGKVIFEKRFPKNARIDVKYSPNTYPKLKRYPGFAYTSESYNRRKVEF